MGETCLTVETSKETICNRVEPAPVTKIYVTATQDLQWQQKQNTEQAPNTGIKEISLTSKELCKGTAEPTPFPGLSRLRQLHMGFLAGRPHPETVPGCVVPRQLFLLAEGLAYLTLPQCHIQA